MAGFGPFDETQPLGLTEYGGGAGLVEGSPKSESGRRGIGVERVLQADEVMPIDEKLGVIYRTPPTAIEGSADDVDPETGLSTTDVV